MKEAQIIDGKALAQKLRGHLAAEIAAHAYHPCLAVILVGENEASRLYVRNKKKAAESIGMRCDVYELSAMTSQNELCELVDRLNGDDSVNGILVQLPLPPHLKESEVTERINPTKDVDGFTSGNLGLLMKQSPQAMTAATPKGILELLYEANRMAGKKDGEERDLTGKNVVIIGRSQIVGRPLSVLLLNHNCTVTVTHSKTINLSEITARADILVSACGCPRMVKADWVKAGATVIDVGTNHVDGKLCGDIDFDDVKSKAAFLTPVPGGVGPMTIAMLLTNTYEAFFNQLLKKQKLPII